MSAATIPAILESTLGLGRSEVQAEEGGKTGAPKTRGPKTEGRKRAENRNPNIRAAQGVRGAFGAATALQSDFVTGRGDWS
jgi:hypothetical protein